MWTNYSSILYENDQLKIAHENKMRQLLHNHHETRREKDGQINKLMNEKEELLKEIKVLANNNTSIIQEKEAMENFYGNTIQRMIHHQKEEKNSFRSILDTYKENLNHSFAVM